MKFFAPCAKGLEYLLVDELKQLGAEEAHEALMGVHFSGTLETGYKAVLWSRLASRVLLVLDSSRIQSAEEMYQKTQNIDWNTHLNPDDSLIIDFVGTNRFIKNSQFGAQKIKDAIVDQFRERFKQRPDIDSDQPTLRINAHLHRNDFSLAIDLSGHPLHERGYRQKSGRAPLKETLAAAILLRANWPTIAENQGCFVDPMCGSGTLAIEAYLMAANIAPGLLREDFGCTQGWRQHDQALWQSLREDATGQKQNTSASFYGFDKDPRVLKVARQNAQRASCDDQIQFKHCELSSLQQPENCPAKGLVISNPPYGERLDQLEYLEGLYAELGERMLSLFNGWQGAIITSEPSLARAMKVRAFKQYALKNGQLDCKLYLFNLSQEEKRKVIVDHSQQLSANAEIVVNRLKKNRKNLSSFIKRENINCYRVYDADIPEYAAAIDVYNDHLFIQEYQAPKSIPEAKSQQRFQDICLAAKQVFEIEEDQLHTRMRARQKGKQQYTKQGRTGKRETIIVEESGLKFEINLNDYLDTGLFLDHRLTRQIIQQRANGKNFLNLFSYTGSVSVYAASGGAKTVSSVDLSHTYSQWAQHNFKLNNLSGKKYQFFEQDVIEWLNKAQNKPMQYDLIFLDPPTFSNSKRTEHTLDIQRDHSMLIKQCMNILSSQGELIFSNNYRKFKLDEEIKNNFLVEEWHQKTLPKDFARNPKIHQCWKICHSKP